MNNKPYPYQCHIFRIILCIVRYQRSYKFVRKSWNIDHNHHSERFYSLWVPSRKSQHPWVSVKSIKCSKLRILRILWFKHTSNLFLNGEHIVQRPLQNSQLYSIIVWFMYIKSIHLLITLTKAHASTVLDFTFVREFVQHSDSAYQRLQLWERELSASCNQSILDSLLLQCIVFFL